MINGIWNPNQVSGRYSLNADFKRAEGKDLNTDVGFFGHKECCKLTMEVIQLLSDFYYMFQPCFLKFIQRVIRKAGVQHSQFSCCESAMDNSNHFIITHITFREQINNREELSCATIHRLWDRGKEVLFKTHEFQPQERMWGCSSACPQVIRDEQDAGDHRKMFVFWRWRQSASALLQILLHWKQQRLYRCPVRHSFATLLVSEHFLVRKRNRRKLRTIIISINIILIYCAPSCM